MKSHRLLLLAAFVCAPSYGDTWAVPLTVPVESVYFYGQFIVKIRVDPNLSVPDEIHLEGSSEELAGVKKRLEVGLNPRLPVVRSHVHLGHYGKNYLSLSANLSQLKGVYLGGQTLGLIYLEQVPQFHLEVNQGANASLLGRFVDYLKLGVYNRGSCFVGIQTINRFDKELKNASFYLEAPHTPLPFFGEKAPFCENTLPGGKSLDDGFKGG